MLVAPGRAPVPNAVIAADVVDGTIVWIERMSARIRRSVGVCPKCSCMSS